MATGRASHSVRDHEADWVLECAKPLVVGIQATLGRIGEVVLHDVRRGDHSVIAVAGDVTHRGVGSSMSEIGLALLRLGDEAEDRLNYMTRQSDGRVVKSSTMLLRTPAGHVVGALCINIDVTQVRMATSLMSDFVGETHEADAALAPITFANDVEAVLDSVLADVEANLGMPLTHLSPADWRRVFQILDERGVFQIRRAVPLLSERLGMSRASIYNYLNRLREGDSASAT